MLRTTPPAGPSRAAGDDLDAAYRAVRDASVALCGSLEPEDYVVQSMPEASPAKWHLAHTTWFFETFLLAPNAPGYRAFHPDYSYLFNSYYNAVGDRLARGDRGLLTRPPIRDVFAYREHVDRAVAALLVAIDAETLAAVAPLVTLGLHHEQQHQELLLTDLKHAFSRNPLWPAYRERPLDDRPAGAAPPLRWISYPEGVRWVGHAGEGFAYDNEGPRHRRFVEGFRIASRLSTAGEYLDFIDHGGYDRHDLWLSDGWAAVQQRGWRAPLYWERRDGRWWHFTLGGMRPVDPAEPVVHVSYYEADAFARWSGARLPTEGEWETAADVAVGGNLVESGRLHPAPAPDGPVNEPVQLFGDAWEWTGDAYLPYPGFRAAPGAVGEYNGKFMCNQQVLRGGSCATPQSHIRPTYRNFFEPGARWQFSGVRLAKDA